MEEDEAHEEEHEEGHEEGHEEEHAGEEEGGHNHSDTFQLVYFLVFIGYALVLLIEKVVFKVREHPHCHDECEEIEEADHVHHHHNHQDCSRDQQR